MPNSKPIINPFLAVFLGVAAASFSSIFTKFADAPPLVIAFYRLSFTVLMLLPAAYVTGRHEIKNLKAKDLLPAVLSGVFLALHFAVWVTSLNYTSVASSTVLVSMHPLFVIIGAQLLFQEKISPWGAAGALIAVLGSAVIGINDFRVGGSALWGDALAFAGAVFEAGYVLIGRSLRARLSLFSYVILVYSAAAVTLLALSIGFAQPLYPYDKITWLWFAALALVPTVFGHTVFNWALRYVQAAVVSVSILGEPVGATVLAYFFFGEVPTALQLIGGTVIITGLYIFITSAAKTAQMQKS